MLLSDLILTVDLTDINKLYITHGYCSGSITCTAILSCSVLSLSVVWCFELLAFVQGSVYLCHILYWIS